MTPQDAHSTGPLFKEMPSLLFGELEIHPQQRVVRVNKEVVPLTAKEFDVLYLLARHPGWVLTKEQIYGTVWQESISFSYHAVEIIICKLRKKLFFSQEGNGKVSFCIETVIGVGYRFNYNK